mgnify:FL=1
MRSWFGILLDYNLQYYNIVNRNIVNRLYERMNDLIDVWNTIVREDYHVLWGMAALYEGIIATIFCQAFR